MALLCKVRGKTSILDFAHACVESAIPGSPGIAVVTREEAIGNAERMFAKMDTNEEEKISPEEMEASRRN